MAPEYLAIGALGIRVAGVHALLGGQDVNLGDLPAAPVRELLESGLEPGDPAVLLLGLGLSRR